MTTRFVPALLLVTLLLNGCDSSNSNPADTGSDSGVDATDDATGTSDLSDAASDATGDTGSGFEFWPLGPAFELEATFYERHAAAFERMSNWATHVVAGDRPETRELGAFAVGNGHIFGIFALTTPLNTLHNFVGPTYEKHVKFFGDYTVRLGPTGESAFVWDEEWAGLSLSAPVVVTRGLEGDISLDIVNVAPWTDGDARNCLVRFFIISNAGTARTAPLEIRVKPTRAAVATEGGGIFETAGERGLVSQFLYGDATVDGNALILSFGAIEAASTAELTLLQCTQDGHEPLAIPSFDPEALLDATAVAYQSWESELVQFDIPDPMVADFLDGMKLTLKLQTTSQGASCPMSGYTRTWARDNIGPVLGWLALGAYEEVAAMMDYVYGGILLGGNLSNSYDADLDLSDLPEPPDWDSKGPLSGRVASETPSYMVWIHGAHYRATGDIARAEDRWGFLRYCTFKVGFEEDRLLPYTGDETFRAAMNATFGLDLEFPHHEESFSLNSQLLWLGATQHFVALAEVLDESDDRDTALEIAAEMDTTVRTRYLLDDDCLSAFIERDTMEPWPAPFEDEALKVTWAGWLGPDDGFAADSIECLLERVGVEPGIVQSPLHEMYAVLPILGAEEGVYTGMLPGYTLSALTDIGHPEAEDAFHAMRLSMGTSGNFQEYIVFDDHNGFTVVYDATGLAQDYTTKYRPWEGGINVAAALQYLLGFEADAPNSHFSLRPHVPEGWPGFGVSNLRVGNDRFDVTLSRGGTDVAVEITSRATSNYTVTVRFDGAGQVALDGEILDNDELTVREHFGVTSAATGHLTLEGGSGLTLEAAP